MAHTADNSVIENTRSKTDWRPLMISNIDNHPVGYQVKVSQRTLVGSATPYHLNRPADQKVAANGQLDEGQELIVCTTGGSNITIDVDTVAEKQNCSNRRFTLCINPTGANTVTLRVFTGTTGARIVRTGATAGATTMTITTGTDILVVPIVVGTDGSFWIPIAEATVASFIVFS